MPPTPFQSADASREARANPGGASSRLGRYQITGRIATGGMATVYLARLQAAGGFSREFALKVVHPHLTEDPGFRRRFVRETSLASRVRHPNAITTIDAGEDQGYSYLVLELIDGVTLRQLLMHLSRPLPPSIAALVTAMVARGLHALHTVRDDDGAILGVVHRDLSPQNVMVERGGRVVLIDLGLAKVDRDADATQVGVLVGKLPYMSPEQARLDPVDARSDVFSLGTVAYELCTGTLPFGDAHTTSTLEKLQACEPEAIAAGLEAHEVPAWLAEIIGRCLRADPRERFDTAHALAEALLEALQRAGHDETTLRRQLAALVEACGSGGLQVHPADPLPPRLEPAPTGGAHPVRWVALGAAGALAMLLGLHLSSAASETSTSSAPSDSPASSDEAGRLRAEPASPAAPSGGLAEPPDEADETPPDDAADPEPAAPRPRVRTRPKPAAELRPNPYTED